MTGVSSPSSVTVPTKKSEVRASKEELSGGTDGRSMMTPPGGPMANGRALSS